jgi:hypothetical protein
VGELSRKERDEHKPLLAKSSLWRLKFYDDIKRLDECGVCAAG